MLQGVGEGVTHFHDISTVKCECQYVEPDKNCMTRIDLLREKENDKKKFFLTFFGKFVPTPPTRSRRGNNFTPS